MSESRNQQEKPTVAALATTRHVGLVSLSNMVVLAKEGTPVDETCVNCN